MELLESINPFVMQLFLVPVIVIGLGVLVSVLTKKVYLAPLITLLFNLIIELLYHGRQTEGFILSSWNIVFPIFSFVVAWVIIFVQKQKTKINNG
ncbi:DUF2651 family protein [Ornithinibacillus halotolerans]|uniref:Uncharacterized protein n=1 Tax=Ornithinibacillus halotolerans TaxID=1274357 RepID=A0A916W494_9BACI|nr:DUF2651 family protein [Ornithinibacillus halotolerans]GGA66275.1 hypothetical protein GCM10008025_07610 [Ornithinibacillus halotolerans]